MEVLSPVDVALGRGARSAKPVRVGGRVVAIDGCHAQIADAFRRLRVELTAAVPLELGDLVIVEGAIEASEERRLVDAKLVTRSPSASGAGAEHGRGARVGEGLRARHAILELVRQHFARDHFLEVETPSVAPSPGLDLHLDAFAVPGLGYLITSPEYQMKRLLAAGVPRCFQLARCFRRGELGDKHNPEFTMLEWYRAFGHLDEIMADTRDLVRIAFASQSKRYLELDGARVDVEAEFEVIAVGDAFARFASVSKDEALELASIDEDRFFRLLVERVEPAIARLDHCVFMTEFPAPFASLARLSPADPRVCERFELYLGPVELSNGFGELTDPVEQRARLARDQAERARRGLPVYPIDERFLAALEEGMPPSVGNALGFDRLVALATGAKRIGDVMAFPADWL